MKDFNMNQHFDQKAAGWDEDAGRLALTADIRSALDHAMACLDNPRMLDYGAGTGLCSLPLAGKCSSLLAVDVSSKMLDQLKEKVRALGLSHVNILQQDFCIEPLIGIEFDVILCAMAMHHVNDIALLLRRFRALLAKGGLLCLADLDQEDGSFHGDNSGVQHFGFKREWLCDLLFKAGFSLVDVQTVHQIKKQTDKGERCYPVFFVAARLLSPASV